MIPLYFMGLKTPPESKSEPSILVDVHSHCWMDPTHITRQKVVTKEKDQELLWHCQECDVRERTKRCRSKCDKGMVTTESGNR